MTKEELRHLPSQLWMPSRIPVRDALAASIPEGTELAKELMAPTYEQRWYPQKDGNLRLLIPYDGATFDSKIFHIEPCGWDHTTCDLCNARIPAMTLCYVTKHDPYIGLCSNCYKEHVAKKVGALRSVLWQFKTWLGLSSAA